VLRADKQAPKAFLNRPSDGATISGTITMAGTATDDVGIVSISFVVDDKWVASDTTADDGNVYRYSLDTTKLSVGKHTLRLRAWDKAGHHTDTKTITVNVAR
jgi:hypothetical protein